MKNKFKVMILTIMLAGTHSYAGGSSTVGPANPAAVNCVKLEGVLENYEMPEGQNANCVVDEWHLYTEMDKRGMVKKPGSGSVALPNPAAVNCYDIGGALRIEDTLEGERGLCVVEQWTLFRAIDVTKEK
ncbi:MAG: DUF333 domain-containing protein [Bdellovibrionaceae bacterium]|nr:DUF333 domain-containing protein [Pseudobdellovibrionaceae bacterium]